MQTSRLGVLGMLLLLGVLVPLVWAVDQDPSTDPFYTKGKPVPLSTVTERVDPFSGHLTIVQRDIHLPGNAGLDLNIVRTYSSAIWGRRDTSFPGMVAVNARSPLGIGWSLHMGEVRNPNGTGSANRFLPNNPVAAMPDGSHQTLFRDKNDGSRLITPAYWVYKAVQSGVWELALTDGTTYTFEFNTAAGYTTADGVQVAQATRIAHANGSATIPHVLHQAEWLLVPHQHPGQCRTPGCFDL